MFLNRRGFFASIAAALAAPKVLPARARSLAAGYFLHQPGNAVYQYVRAAEEINAGDFVVGPATGVRKARSGVDRCISGIALGRIKAGNYGFVMTQGMLNLPFAQSDRT